jgi:hypothetical protein
LRESALHARHLRGCAGARETLLLHLALQFLDCMLGLTKGFSCLKLRSVENNRGFIFTCDI